MGGQLGAFVVFSCFGSLCCISRYSPLKIPLIVNDILKELDDHGIARG